MTNPEHCPDCANPAADLSRPAADQFGVCLARHPERPEWAWVQCANGTIARLRQELAEPVPMFLSCPFCRARHIDEGEFATKVHHTHSCQLCGLTWRPAVRATVGVHFLPGFKNEEAKEPNV